MPGGAPANPRCASPAVVGGAPAPRGSAHPARECSGSSELPLSARLDRRHSAHAGSGVEAICGRSTVELLDRSCISTRATTRPALWAPVSAISRAEPSAPRAPCSSPAEASGPLATGRLLCKREAESGRLGSSRDTAALPLEEPRPRKPAGHRFHCLTAWDRTCGLDKALVRVSAGMAGMRRLL